MWGRSELVAPDTYAVFDDRKREVYFEKHLSASEVIRTAVAPKGFNVPQGYRIVADPPQRWATPSSGWVV